MKKTLIKSNNGVTLISLVVTIIVLLIISGISIALLNGNNGILTKATEAKSMTEKSALIEKIKTDILAQQSADNNGNLTSIALKQILLKYFGNVPSSDSLSSDTLLTAKNEFGSYELKISDIYNGKIVITSYYTYTDSEGQKIPIPADFTVSSKENENKASKGLVISDDNGNEFVWIPCSVDSTNFTKTQYNRAEWNVEDDNDTLASKNELTLNLPDSTCSSYDIQYGLNSTITNEIVLQINNEKNSISKYGGYYIGRYETGINQEKPIIKYNQTPYSNIIWSKAYNLAKNFINTIGVDSYLCSGYSFDTAINFIQNSGTLNYATSGSFNENWHYRFVTNGTEIIKPLNESLLLNTGLTTPQNNIYDMGGNVAEFTTEVHPGINESIIIRGGSYIDVNPAGNRLDTTVNYKSDSIGFRITLFLK
ncbi:MAG: hypothetical protein ACLS90_08925 [Clostridia bacterium]